MPVVAWIIEVGVVCSYIVHAKTAASARWNAVRLYWHSAGVGKFKTWPSTTVVRCPAHDRRPDYQHLLAQTTTNQAAVANPKLDQWNVGGDGIPVQHGDHVTEQDGELVTLHKDGSTTKFC